MSPALKGKALIGADIGGTNMRTALVDARGKIMLQRRSPTNICLGPKNTSSRLAAECRALKEEACALGYAIEAIGIGVAGKIDRRMGRVIFSPNLPSMIDYPLARELQNELDVPVIMENDANMFGLGENLLGAGRGIRNWLGVTLGTGVGGCLILDGKLWSGDDLGFVGEVGHMIVRPGGLKCACGLKGCLEAYASGSSLIAGVGAAISEGALSEGPLLDLYGGGNLEPVDAYRAACKGDATAKGLFDRMGWALGVAIANLFTVLGIRCAIIGGGVSAAWDLFIDSLHKSLAEHSSMLSHDRMIIRRSDLGDDAALIGAAWLAQNE